MPTPPLRLRLTRAQVLRDRRMVARTVAIEAGRISAGPFPAVDLSGYLVLPGIIDMLSHQSSGSGGTDIADVAQRLACAGVTTAWLAHRAHAPAMLAPDGPPPPDLDAALAGHERPGLGCDLRPALIAERLLADPADRILAPVRRHGVSLVAFADTLPRRLAQSDTDPDGFAHWARTQNASPAALLARLRRAHDGRAQIPRALCRLADAFDRDGIPYGSLGDPDGETRETWHMLGAGLCFSPRATGAAAVAQAVSSPVICSAAELLPPGPPSLPIERLIRAGRCQALSSGDDPGSLARGAFALVASGQLDLPQAWRLISEDPARIMGLPDRGEITPGRRADLTIVNAATHQVEATLCHGRITHLTGAAAARFMHSATVQSLAAE